MFEVDNFISFHDLTPDGTFIWTSPSVTAILGYEPEEIEGVPAYDVMHKDDIAYCRVTHQENVLNDMVGTQIVVRFKHKDGSYVPCMCIFSVCYDYIVTCSTVIDTAQEACKYLLQ
jgi:PAS domain S-box-containing protein